MLSSRRLDDRVPDGACRRPERSARSAVGEPPSAAPAGPDRLVRAGACSGRGAGRIDPALVLRVAPKQALAPISTRRPIGRRCERARRHLGGLSVVTFVFFVVLNGVYLVLTARVVELRSEVRGRRYLALDEVFRSPLTPRISVLVPAFNEEAGSSRRCSLLALRYPARGRRRQRRLDRRDGAPCCEAFDLAPVRRRSRTASPRQPVRGTYVSRRHQPRDGRQRQRWELGRSERGNERGAAPVICVSTPTRCSRRTRC